MAILPPMETIKLPTPASIRTTPRIQHAFKLAVQRLALSDSARVLGSKPTMELATAALWHWFSRMGPDESERFLADRFADLEVALKDEGIVAGVAPAGKAEVKVSEAAKERKRKGAR